MSEAAPWKKAIDRSLIGMAMYTVTLNFRGLNYILPTIGILLALLGFRALRGENRGFWGCWVITIIQTMCFLPMRMLDATIFRSDEYGLPVFHTFAAVNLVLNFLLLFCLWEGLRTVRQKAHLPVRVNGAAALILWYAVMCLLGLFQYRGLLLGLLMIVSYVVIIRSIFKISTELEKAGEVLSVSLMRVPDRLAAVVFFAILFGGIAIGYLFFNRYPMEWKKAEQTGDAKTEEIKEHLLHIGFPGKELDDLSDEELKACEGALRVVASVQEYPIDDGRRVTDDAVRELRITGIAVELPGEQKQWKIFHHFRWTRNPGFYGTESLQLWPADRVEEGWGDASEAAGRVLYDKEGQVYCAPYYFLGKKTYTSDSIFWGGQTSTDVFAAFSMPGNGENHRGYLSYTIREIEDGWLLDSWVNYTHQRSRMQYPVRTAMEQRMANGLNQAGAFVTIQDALQFFPNDAVPEPF